MNKTQLKKDIKYCFENSDYRIEFYRYDECVACFMGSESFSFNEIDEKEFLKELEFRKDNDCYRVWFTFRNMVICIDFDTYELRSI